MSANFDDTHCALARTSVVRLRPVVLRVAWKQRLIIYSVFAPLLSPAGLEGTSSRINIYFCALSPRAEGAKSWNLPELITARADLAASSRRTRARVSSLRNFCHVPSKRATRLRNACAPSALTRPSSTSLMDLSSSEAFLRSSIMKSTTMPRSSRLAFMRGSLTSIGSSTRMQLPNFCTRLK